MMHVYTTTAVEHVPVLGRHVVRNIITFLLQSGLKIRHIYGQIPQLIVLQGVPKQADKK